MTTTRRRLRWASRLFEERIGEIAAAGHHALAASDPWDGLTAFLYDANALLARDRGLKQALLSRGAHETERAREKIVPIATELVTRDQLAAASVTFTHSRS
jgi:hypothetical protein